MSRAIEYRRFGGPEVLEMVDVPAPEPRDGETRIAVKAAALNPMDEKVFSGDPRLRLVGFANAIPKPAQWFMPSFPKRVGRDFAGIVDAVGGGTSGLAVGDTVLGTLRGAPGTKTKSGSLAEHVVAPVEDVIHKPKALSFESAAALGVVAQTACGWCHRVVATVLVKEGLLVRRLLTVTDRAGIARGLAEGCGLREIARRIGRDVSVVSREVARNQGETGYKCVAADVAAQRRRARPKLRKIDADLVLKQRVIADLRRSRTPRQIAGRLRAEAGGDRLEPCQGSPTAQGASVSHEAIYTWIYAMPKKTLREHGVMLGSKRTSRQSRRRLGERKSPIVGMVSIDQRPQEVTGRKVPGHWEGDLIIGAYGRTAAITLVERTTRFVTILALPKGKNADGVCDALIDHITGLPELMKGTLTWDQGSEMARHAAFTMATQMPVYFAHPHSPWERGSNENTNRLIRDYLPKGTPIPQHQPYLTAIAEELNERPRATLGYLTPREAFQKLLVASTT